MEWSYLLQRNKGKIKADSEVDTEKSFCLMNQHPQHKVKLKEYESCDAFTAGVHCNYRKK